MRRFVISVNLIFFLSSITAELLGNGPITHWRENHPYAMFVDTGLWGRFVFAYFVFCLLLPFVNFVALLLNPQVRIKS